MPTTNQASAGLARGGIVSSAARARAGAAALLSCLLCMAMGALHAQDGASDADYLRHFPTPERVRADIVAKAGDARPEEVVARQAGRLMMLGETLAHPYGGKVRGAPPMAQKLHAAYWDAYGRIRDGERKRFIADDCGAASKLTGSCVRTNYLRAEGEYKHGLDPALETAALYFPEQYRERFVEATPGQLTRKWTAENRARRGAEESAAEASDEGGNGLVWIGGGALALLAVVILLARRPGHDRAPARTLEQLQASVRSGTVVGSQQWTETSFSSTTSTSGGGGHIHNGSGYVSAPQSSTTVRSRAIEFLRVFVREDDGTEFEATFSELGFGVRDGHRVSVVFAAFPDDSGALDPRPMALVNHSTRKHKMLWGRVGWIVKNDRKLSEEVLARLTALTQQTAAQAETPPA